MNDTIDREPYGNPRYHEHISITAFLYSPGAAMAGNVPVSAETKPQWGGCEVLHRLYSPYVIELILLDPPRFVSVVRELPPFVQDCVFQFYFLGRLPAQIGFLLGSHRNFVQRALALSEKAIIAKACGVEPEGIDEVWAEMKRLNHQRRRDGVQLKVKAPVSLGKFVVKLEDSAFPQFFPPRELNGSIVRAM